MKEAYIFENTDDYDVADPSLDASEEDYPTLFDDVTPDKIRKSITNLGQPKGTDSKFFFLNHNFVRV